MTSGVGIAERPQFLDFSEADCVDVSIDRFVNAAQQNLQSLPALGRALFVGDKDLVRDTSVASSLRQYELPFEFILARLGLNRQTAARLAAIQRRQVSVAPVGGRSVQH